MNAIFGRLSIEFTVRAVTGILETNVSAIPIEQPVSSARSRSQRPSHEVAGRGTMALFKAGNIVTGLAVGVGAAVVAPAIVPMLRPLAKAVIKAGLMAYDRGRLTLTDLNERTGDIVAEARAELAEAAQESKTKPAPERRTPTPPAAETGARTPA